MQIDFRREMVSDQYVSYDIELPVGIYKLTEQAEVYTAGILG